MSGDGKGILGTLKQKTGCVSSNDTLRHERGYMSAGGRGGKVAAFTLNHVERMGFARVGRMCSGFLLSTKPGLSPVVPSPQKNKWKSRIWPQQGTSFCAGIGARFI